MPEKLKTIGVITGGGDAPGLNAVIRAVVKTATKQYQMHVLGIEAGFEGLLEPLSLRELTVNDVRGLLARGGTILGARNKGPFKMKPSEDGAQELYRECIANMRQIGIDGLIVIGGDGSQRIALEFYRLGVPIVGVPKTIDNDLACTQLTFGLDTAVGIATEALDRLHTTAESHDRVMVLEVMGRNAGWIALHAGIAGGADCILIPEIPYQADKIAGKVIEREAQGKNFSIIIVAEGAMPVGGKAVYQPKGQLGGIGYQIAEEIEERTGRDTRVVVLGHLQRGGQPTTVDRLLATCFGVTAVHLIANGDYGKMVSLSGSEVVGVELERAVAKLKTVPPDGYLVGVARNLGISFAGECD